MDQLKTRKKIHPRFVVDRIGKEWGRSDSTGISK